MSNFIILTPGQADKVRCLSTKGHALVPVPLKDGTLILPAEVVNDPAHAALASFLKTLPSRSVSLGTPTAKPSDVVTDGEVSTDPVIQSKYAFKSDWGVGVLVALN